MKEGLLLATLAQTGSAEHAQQGGPNLQVTRWAPTVPVTDPHILIHTPTVSGEDSATRDQDHPAHTQEHSTSALPPPPTASTTTPEAAAGTGGGRHQQEARQTALEGS